METMLADDLFSETPPAIPNSDTVADLDLDAPGQSAHGDAGAEDFDVSSSDLEQSIPEMPNLDLSDPGTAQVEDDFQLSDGLLAGAPPAHAESPVAEAGAAAPGPGPGPDLTPMMRDRVHETLERVAWEAFSDLSDTVVKQVVEKVEQVAWEVIPQMAESIIREEIRRMKGESDE